MEFLTWFLTFSALAVWAVVGLELLRRPPSLPGEWSPGRLRTLWGAVWIVALVGGLWGPTLWSHTTLEHPRDVTVGPPAERASSVLRTPFAVQGFETDRNAAGQVLRTESEIRLQLPVVLLLFLAGVLLVRTRDRRGTREAGGRRRFGPPAAGMAVALATLAACGGDFDGSQAPRPDRQLVEVRWDTLTLIELAPEDTLVFSVNDMTASSRGLWVLDRIGRRVAHFDWEGRLRWYAGRAGAGPGEFMNPRVLSLDSLDRVWVLDMSNNRITGFGPDGTLVDEVPLRNVDAVLHTFAASPTGDRFFGMIMGDGLHPVAIDRSGRVERGRRIRIRDAPGATSIAFQGYARSLGQPDRWLYAFTTGDGYFVMEGVEPVRERVRYPEWIPFPGTVVQEGGDQQGTFTTQAMATPNFSAGDVAVTRDRIVIRFRGESDDAGRLLDTYDLTGEYLTSLRLPRGGRVTAWADRVVLAWNDPAPRFLILESGG